MALFQDDLKQQNTIAYDMNLRERLKVLHQLLGEDITDIASAAMDYGIKFQPQAKDILKEVSELTSDLSVAVLEAKNDKQTLSAEEEEDARQLSEITNILGNLQFKLNKVIMAIDKFKALAEELNSVGVALAEEIVHAQEHFRDLRADFNALGFLSKNPKISMLLDEPANV